MFSKIGVEEMGNYFIYYSFSGTLDSFCDLLEQYSSSIRSINLTEDNDVSFGTFHGTYSYDEFKNLQNRIDISDAKSLIITFDDNQEFHYNVNKNSIVAVSNDANFDIDEYFDKKKGMTL